MTVPNPHDAATSVMHTPTPPEIDPEAPPPPSIDPDPPPAPDDDPGRPPRAPEGDPPAQPPPVHARAPRAAYRPSACTWGPDSRAPRRVRRGPRLTNQNWCSMPT